jgi:hypothetical protein
MTAQSRMTAYSNRREWDLDGHEITYLHIDYRFGFDCWWHVEEPEHENLLSVTIEMPFTLELATGIVECEPADTDTLGPALSILHKSLSKFIAFEDGTMEAVFSDGTKVRVSKHQQYESWEAHGEGELKDVALLCSPHEGPPWRQG